MERKYKFKCLLCGETTTGTTYPSWDGCKEARDGKHQWSANEIKE